MIRKKKGKMGRPPKSKDQKYSEFISIKVTRKEKAMLSQKAKKRGITLSTLMMGSWRS